MKDEVFPVFLGNQCVPAVRADQPDGRGDLFAIDKSLATDFTLVLTVSAVVVVDEMVWGTTERTDNVLGNGFTIPALNRFYGFTVLPVVVLEEKLPILFDKGLDQRELVNLEFLILWGVGIIMSPLLKRNIFADKI